MSIPDRPALDRLPLELPKRVSRREFLHLSGMGLLGLGVPLRWTRSNLEASDGQLGRILIEKADIYVEPTFLAAPRQDAVARRGQPDPLGGDGRSPAGDESGLV